MVAKITVPQTVRRALNYNEQKVQQGKAQCIHAGNYLKDAHEMNFYEKLERFQKQIELNEANTNTLHISLNFDPSDKIDTDKMLAIAKDYMERIGFGAQPYLVYEHYDAGHKHCHIVTTNIKEDGKRIDTFNIGKNKSEPARKAIERDYHLVKAEGRRQSKTPQIEPAEKIHYGKSDTKRSITNVLDAVIDKYKYASLAELNAILRLYNVEADRGKEGSRTHDKGGLHYRVIDERGNKIGVPIKASSIYSNPTLKNLQQNFEKKKAAKTIEERNALKTKIDWILANKPESLKDFIIRLSQEKVDVAVRQNAKGQIYGLTYIDHENKTVFNGSDLGKQYSANSIQHQLSSVNNMSPELTPKKSKERHTTLEKEEANEPHQPGRSASFSLLENLMQTETGATINRELMDEQKRKRHRLNQVDQEHEM